MKRFILLVGVLTLALSGCSRLIAPKGQEASPVGRDSNVQPAISGEILVQTRSSAAVQGLKGKYEVKTVDASTGVYLLKSPALKGKEDPIVQALMKTGSFDIVEKNYMRRVSAPVPRDPKWLEQWSFKNYGQDAPGGTEGVSGADIKALEAWSVTTGSKKIVVAVIDTGIDYSHPDLKVNMWVNEAEKNGIAGIDDDGNSYTDDVYGWDFVSGTREELYYGQLGDPDPMDDYGHGTHVSGTIGAVGGNAIGVAGINWNVSLMALKFLDRNGSGSSADEYRALRYAIRNGVDVINASYGGGGPSKLVEMALKEAGEKGILFVAAAGNNSENNDAVLQYPAGYRLDNIVAVAATDNRDQLAQFSNYGFQTVHIAAPGVAITSTYPVALARDEAPDLLPYRVFSGTSMATPHVVGAAALALAADPKLLKHPAELKARLLGSADWLPQLAGKVANGGRLNLANAVSGTLGSSPVGQRGWVEEAFLLSTPRYPQENLDLNIKIQKVGAKAIQLHVARAIIDDFDYSALFDGFFRPIVEIPALAYDLWLPVILGDTAYLKFSNAMVSIERYLGDETVDDPTELIDSGRAKACFGDGSKWKCSIYADPTPPFANFNSEGVEIDRIRYLPALSQ